jgi:hypothetical protein
VIHKENILRLVLNRAGNALAVLRAKDQRAQNQKVESALEERDSLVRGFLGGHST